MAQMSTAVKTVAISIASPIAVVGWIVAGILYLTAAGAPERMGTAKKAVIACVIGTILIVLAIANDAIISVITDAFGLGAGAGAGG